MAELDKERKYPEKKLNSLGTYQSNTALTLAPRNHR
jgi:hypothetical protein